ncbi:MAG: hypothetical protein AABX65_02065, partial [Nanoarchaeota archaeon]
KLANIAGTVVLVTAAGGAALGTGKAAWEYLDDKVTTTITGTDVKRYDGEDVYLIFTTDGTFDLLSKH